MADHSITVSNTLTFHGHGYPTIWNSFTWNSAAWGWSADSEVRVTKVIDSTATPTTTIGKYVAHALDVEALALVSEIINLFIVAIDNTLSVSSDMYSQTLADSNGYSHVFPGGATNAEDRDIPDWTSGANGSTSWTPASSTATDWSAA